MLCNPKLRGNPLTPIQLLVTEANNEIIKQCKNIKETFKAINLKMTTLTVHTTQSTSTIDIETLELEAQVLITRLETLVSSHKSTLEMLPAGLLIELYVASGVTQEKAEAGAQEGVARFKKRQQDWEKGFHTLKKILDIGRTGFDGWDGVKKIAIMNIGKERVMRIQNGA